MQFPGLLHRICGLGLTLALTLLLVTPARAGDGCAQPTQFRACENATGSGLFWVETTTGRLWWADSATMTWVYQGQPQGATPGPRGTYLPYANASGEGVFVLNTGTGAGWWANGKTWKALGMPVTRPSAVEAGSTTNLPDASHE